MTNKDQQQFKSYDLFGSRVMTHILFWVLYYIFFGLLWARDGDYFKSFSLELVLMPLRIGTTYFCIYYLMPHLLLQGKVVRFLFAYLGMLIVAGMGQRLLIFFFYEQFFPNERHDLFDFMLLVRAIVLVNSTVMLISAFKMYRYWAEEKQKNQKLREQPIEIRSEKRFYRVLPSNIQYIEGLGNYVTIYQKGQKPLISYMTLKEAKAKLPDYFLRIHKSFIINKALVDSYNHESVEINARILPIGKSFDMELLSF
ncbi:MAG: LytTR family DNA-binding domain-containing protein [Bacteroidota bacterium]